MDNVFREKLVKTLLLIGGVSSFVNLPILYQVSHLFTYMVVIFSMSYILIYVLFIKNRLSYDQASGMALVVLFLQVLNIPLHTGMDTFFMPWVLIYPMVVFGLKSSRYGIISSILLLILFLALYFLSYMHSSYHILHILTFSSLYITVVIVFYFMNKNVKTKEQMLENMNNTLTNSVKVATHSLELQNDKLHESVDNFQDLLDTTMEMIVLFDENKIIIDVNQSAVNILGYKHKSEVIGTSIISHVHQDELPTLQERLKQEISPPQELNILKKDGSSIVTLSAGRDILRDGKKVRMSTLLDLTDIKVKEKLLQQQTRLAQMGEMISMISHQWRQPLGAISSAVIGIKIKRASGKFNLDIKEERDNFLDYSDNKLNHITEFVQILSTTIDDFRNFFKPDKDKEMVELAAPIKRALSIVKISMSSKNIIITEDYQNNDEILMYQNEMMQVILNILKNSEDNFTEKNIQNSCINIKTYKEKNRLMIEVSDNGGGIPEDIIESIFDPYFSTKEEKNGTGLGLYMSKIIVEEHNGGKLSVINRDKGVCFSIQL